MENEIKKVDANDLNFMKQYLKDLYTLEKERYCSERAKQKYDNIIDSLGKSSLNHKDKDFGRRKGKFSLSWFLISGVFLGIIFGIGGAVAGILLLFFIESAAGRVMVGFIIGFLFGILKGFSGEVEYKNRKNEEYQIRQADTERVEKELEQSELYKENRISYVQNIDSCNQALKQLYDLDIIFPKYRNFIAISQIYEYYMSGRCTTLEGHEGAYNIFESEARQNVIIMQLNNVLNQLEQIKQNQYLIYQAVQESNLILNQIESNTAAIAYNTSVIAENSSICARYA